MQLAREPPPLELLAGDHTAEGVAGDALREVDRRRRPLRERLCDPQVVVGEARVAADLVEGAHDADRFVPQHERDEQAGARADPAGELLVDLGVVDDRVDALAPPPLEDPRALGAGLGHDRAHQRACALAVCGLDPKAPVGTRSSDHDRLRADQLAEPLGDQSEHARQLDLGQERVPDLVQRLQLAEPARRRLIEPRVLDRDRGLGGEKRDDLLVLVLEVGAALLVGQIEVAVGDPA